MDRRRRTAERWGKPGAVALWPDFGEDGFVESLLRKLMKAFDERVGRHPVFSVLVGVGEK